MILLTDGTKIENPKWLRKTEKRIKLIQKSLSRKQKHMHHLLQKNDVRKQQQNLFSSSSIVNSIVIV